MRPRRASSSTHPPGGSDDATIVDWVRQPPNKRKGKDDQPNPRPAKRQTFWVEVPPRPKRVSSVSVKREPSSPDVAIETEGATLAVKRELDQEASNALSVIRSANVEVSHNPHPELREV